MKGGGRCSTALLLLALTTLATSSTTAAGAAQRCQPPAGVRYKLITLWTSRGAQVRIAARADVTSIAGFANGKNNWFAVLGSEEPFRNRYGSGDDIPGHGIVNLLSAMLKKNTTS